MKLTLGRSGWLAVLAAFATLAPVSGTFGATYTWTGGGPNNAWFTSGQVLSTNWNPSGGTLFATDNLIFDFGTRPTAFQGYNPATSATASATNISFIGSTSGSITGNSALTLLGNITNSSGAVQSIGTAGSNLFMNGSAQTLDGGSGGLRIQKNLRGSGDLTVLGSGTQTYSDPSSFAGTLTTGSTPLSFSNTFGTTASKLTNNGAIITGVSGVAGTYIQTAGTGTFAGTVGASSPLGSGTVTISGGDFYAGTVNQLLLTGGTATVGNVNSDSVVEGGKLILPDFPAAGVSAFNFTVKGGEVVSTTGNGVVFNESLTVSGGTVNIQNVNGAGGLATTGGLVKYHTDPSGPVPPSITGNAVLGGNNVIDDGVSSFVSFQSDLTLTSTNNFNIDFTKNDTETQRVNVGAALVYGGTLALNFTSTGTAATGNEYNMFDFGSQSGNLDMITLSATGEPSYQGLAFFTATSSASIYDQRYGAGIWLSDWTAGSQRFIFNQADGVLTVVPEPSTIVFAGIGAAMLGWQTWAGRRRKARMKLIDEHTRKLSEERGLA